MAEQTGKDASAKRGLNRRSVVKGAAWSVPAVVVASAAPAMASASSPVTIDFGNSTACKLPGNSWGTRGYNKGYVLWAAFDNTSAVDLWIKVTDIKVGGVDQCLVAVVDTTVEPEVCPPTSTNSCIRIPAGDTKIVGIFSNASTDSSSTTVKVNFTIYEGTACTGVSTATSDSGDLNGQSWTSGGGSCDFPSGYACRTPPQVSTCLN